MGQRHEVKLVTARQIQPFWADFFALGSSISEGHRGILKYLLPDHPSPSFQAKNGVKSP